MAIRLTFDVIGSTCGDLLRFADAVRAAGAQPEFPLQPGSGPNRIEVVVDDRGGYMPGPRLTAMPPFGPPGVPGPYTHPGPVPGPQGFRYQGRPAGEPPVGCVIEVNWGTRSRKSQVRIETVDRYRAALDLALAGAEIDDASRAALRELRESFSDQEPSPGAYGS